MKNNNIYKSKVFKYTFSILLTTAIISGGTYAWTNLPAVSQKDPLTASSWNSIVNFVNENGNKLSPITNNGGNIEVAGDIKENGDLLSNKYLGINATAFDSSKIQNKTPETTLTDTDDKIPTSKAVKTYVDTQVASGVSGALKFVDGTDTSDAVYMDGNVGIGTTTPGYKLDVNGDVNFPNNVYLGGANGYEWSLNKSSGGDNTVYLRQNGTGGPEFQFNGDGSNYNNSNITIGNNSVKINSNGYSYLNGGNVGIGTTTPSEKLEVAGDIAIPYGSELKTSATTHSARTILKTGWESGIGDFLDLYTPGDGQTNTARVRITEKGKIITQAYDRRGGIYGTYDSTKVANIWSMGNAYQVNSAGTNFGNLYGLAYKHTNNTTGGTMAGGHQMVWAQNGIPYAALGTNIWAKNSVYAESFIYNSDRRLKKNISTLDNSLENISKLRGVSFNWKESGKKEIGLIAQEVEEVYPDLVTTNEDGMKGVKYGNVVAILIEGVKELYNKVTGNSDEIKELKIENKKLEDKVVDLEEKMKILEEKINKIIK